ncbi:Hypothetical Protein FCC1311_042562 [Hondaea fermentalgiana]|uniref:Uncharacterized protein n=1 Tax=Hondaea fermentalgiana TaxID=2315210 RepID=A0A2R5GHA9_9STRA|nr:Hypothetical Protein FCC1311_042562 [Hondaea fermentalgiana]|eukprot:GBG28033.1 Hypothetical Protein FCC1311_042562 [Hondaea fermentalgiana]
MSCYGAYSASSTCCSSCPSAAEICQNYYGSVVCYDEDGFVVSSDVSSALSGVMIGILVFIVVLWVVTFLGLWYAIRTLQQKEAHLPLEQRSLTCGMIVLMVLMTLCLGLIGLLLMYVIVNNQINSAINRNAMQQMMTANKV